MHLKIVRCNISRTFGFYNTLIFDEDLKSIPYGFIDRVGSIRFMNQAEGLHKVIRYVQSDFLMKVISL